MASSPRTIASRHPGAPVPASSFVDVIVDGWDGDAVGGDAVRDAASGVPQIVIATGDDEALLFDAFAASIGARLLRTAYLLTGDLHEAQDLVQDTLVRIWTRWELVSSADNPQAYAHTVLVSRSVSRWRSARRRVMRERLVPVPPELDHAVTADERDDILWQLVLGLPPRQRAVMVLTYYDDFAEDDIARILGCSVGTVKSQRAKSLRALRLRLAADEGQRHE